MFIIDVHTESITSFPCRPVCAFCVQLGSRPQELLDTKKWITLSGVSGLPTGRGRCGCIYFESQLCRQPNRFAAIYL